MTDRERWRAYAVCVLGWLFDFYDLILFAYLAKAIGSEMGWGAAFPHYKALLVGIALATSGLGGIVFGGLADLFGRKRIMAWTILVYSIGTGLCSVAGGLVSLAVFRALTGLGVGGEWATGHALMAEIFPKEKRGLASALLQAGEPVGVALAVLAGLWLEPRIGWRWVFALSALPALLVVLVRRAVPESPLWLARQGRIPIDAGELGSRETAPTRSAMGRSGTTPPRSAAERGGARGSDQPLVAAVLRSAFFEQYRTLFRDHWRLALKGWVLGASKLGTYWLTYVWLPEYFAELGQMHGAPEGAVFASIRLTFILVAQGGQLIGMLLFGLVSDRIGRRPAFCAYSLLTAAGLFALAGFGREMLAHPVWFWPAMGAVGLGSGCTAGFGALLAELFPTSIRNTAMGTVYNLARAFQFVTMAVMGILIAEAGVAHGLYLAMAFALVTASWIWTFPETRGIPLDAR